MKILFIIFHCVMAFVSLSESLESEQIHFGKWLQNSKDDDLGVYTFEWMINVSINDCIGACKSTKACEYINFEIRAHKCALIRTKDSNYVVKVGDKPGFIFGNKSEWSVEAEAACDDCPSYGICHIDGRMTDDDSMCRSSGCGEPGCNDCYGNMYTSGGRIRMNCDDGYGYCPMRRCTENGTWLTDTVCPNYSFKGSCYFVQTVLMTWFEAKSRCEDMFGHLIDINTEEEEKFLESLLFGSFTWIIWIGGNDLDNEGDFRWSDGTAVSGYTNWGFANPDNDAGAEHCILKVIGIWYDGYCLWKYRSVCEIQ